MCHFSAVYVIIIQNWTLLYIISLYPGDLMRLLIIFYTVNNRKQKDVSKFHQFQRRITAALITSLMRQFSPPFQVCIPVIITFYPQVDVELHCTFFISATYTNLPMRYIINLVLMVQNMISIQYNHSFIEEWMLFKTVYTLNIDNIPQWKEYLLTYLNVDIISIKIAGKRND